ncbi:MAG: hypothetical protein PHD46_05610 [Eubacteriales bacterium]|nr:hypothetical protein [Eubacteriales bacterium]MDD4422495.1 hypothetical protein [Eubacteriales bacterium]
MKSKENNRKKKTIVILVLSALLVLASSIGILALTNPGIFSRPAESSAGETKRLDENGRAIDGALQNKSSDEILKELQEKQINVTDKLSSHVYFPSGCSGTEGSWIVENVESNTVTIQCEVYLGDKMIAKTVPIKPNQHIETIILSEDVEAGEYDVVAYVNYYDPDSGNFLAKAGFKIRLTVQ